MYLQDIALFQKVNSTLANLYIIRMIIRMGIMVVLSVRVRNYFRNFITLIFLQKVMEIQNGKQSLKFCMLTVCMN